MAGTCVYFCISLFVVVNFVCLWFVCVGLVLSSSQIRYNGIKLSQYKNIYLKKHNRLPEVWLMIDSLQHN